MGKVVVVTGAGGMGVACARRLGSGRRLVLADFDGDKLDREAGALARDGHAVSALQVDVSDRSSVDALVAMAGGEGTLRTLVHTAGLSPTMASPERVLEVDMVGTDHVLSAFAALATDGTVGVFVASMAGYLAGLSPQQEHRLRTAPTDDLIATVGPVGELGFGASYCIAKRVNQLRVEQAAASWGKVGARLVTISPGIISTAMGRQELEHGAREAMEQQLAMSALARMGTPEDIAAAVDWLASPSAALITGCDLRVDGGVTAAVLGLGLGLGG